MRHYGYVPDAHDQRDVRFASPLRSPQRSATSLAEHVRPGLDQRRTNSCVGFAIAQSLWVRMGVLGATERVFASPLAIYANARLRARQSLADDVGCRPRDAWAMLQKLGWCADSVWPFGEERAKRMPPWSAYRLSADRRWLRYERIASFGTERSADVRDALSHGRPVALGLSVDRVFSELAAGDIWRGPVRPQDVTGRHYVLAVGFDGGSVEVSNSWGSDWAEGGFGRIAWDALESSWITSDLYTPEVVP